MASPPPSTTLPSLSPVPTASPSLAFMDDDGWFDDDGTCDFVVQYVGEMGGRGAQGRGGGLGGEGGGSTAANHGEPLPWSSPNTSTQVCWRAVVSRQHRPHHGLRRACLLFSRCAAAFRSRGRRVLSWRGLTRPCPSLSFVFSPHSLAINGVSRDLPATYGIICSTPCDGGGTGGVHSTLTDSRLPSTRRRRHHHRPRFACFSTRHRWCCP